MTRKLFGLDLFDVVVHVVVTGTVAGVVGEMVHGSAGDAAIWSVLAAGLLVLSWRRKRALAAKPPGEADSDRVDDLEARLQELEHAQDRVLELEERLDFAERLLARQREPERLG